MNDSYAHAGKRIADRFELISRVSPQPKLDHASVWLAEDTIRSVKLRAIVIDPEFSGSERVLDEARKTSYLDADSEAIANMVSTIAVVSDDADQAIFTEIPPGKALSVFLGEKPLQPKLVHSLIGDIVSAINLSKSRGLRHLALTPDDVYLTDAGDVVIDGYGIQAALKDVPSNLSNEELDRYEAVGLANLLAYLLIGKVTTDTELGEINQESVQSARDIAELPAELRNLLDELSSGYIPDSPNELLLKLVPWDDIDMSLLAARETDLFTGPTGGTIPHAIFPKVFDDDADGESADNDVTDDDVTDDDVTDGESTEIDVDQSAHGVADSDVDTTEEVVANETEPNAEPEPTEELDVVEKDVVEEPNAVETEDSTPNETKPLPEETEPETYSAVEKTKKIGERARRRAMERVEVAKNLDLDKPINTSHFVITILVIVVLLAAIFAVKGLLSPLREVDVEPEKPHTSQVDGAAGSAGPEASAAPPVISEINLVDPDSGKYFPANPVPNSPETLPKAIDGDAATNWLSWYFNEPDMGAISGIGVHLTFKEAATLSGMTLTFDGKGGNLQVRTGSDPASGDLLYEGPVDGATHLTFDPPAETSDVLLWFTELPVDSKGYNRISLAEITVE